jgi:arylsulfatase
MWDEGKLGYLRWYADNMWLFVPIQAKVQEFLASLDGYPFQAGSSLSASGINYRSLKAMKILKEMEKSSFPINR